MRLPMIRTPSLLIFWAAFSSASFPQILIPTMCEKIFLNQMVIALDYDLSNLEANNHLNLFN